MYISEQIKTKSVNCFTGDLVQYNHEVCMVINLNPEGWSISSNYGLLALTGIEAGGVVLEDKTLVELDKEIQGVILKSDQIYITTMEEKEKWES